MHNLATAPSLTAPARSDKIARALKILVWAAILTLAVGFVLEYVFRYYLHYNEAAFTDPIRGAANYWRMRDWLLLHMSGGMLALLSGPWQFWSGLRQRHMRIHRWTGRLFFDWSSAGVDRRSSTRRFDHLRMGVWLLTSGASFGLGKHSGHGLVLNS